MHRFYIRLGKLLMNGFIGVLFGICGFMLGYVVMEVATLKRVDRWDTLQSFCHTKGMSYIRIDSPGVILCGKKFIKEENE